MELKPCPFCGGEARLIEAEIGMFEDGYAVYCGGTCGVKMGVYGRLGEAYKWTPSFSTETEAIEAWNTRAERTCHDANTRFNAWQCSECGATLLLMFDDYGEPTYSVDGVADVPSFCPNCGAKVVE